MQRITINNKIPRVYYACSNAPVQHTTRNMSLFPRLVASEFAPMFRLIDDYASHVASRSGGNWGAGLSHSLRSFQPRFDVKEDSESYQLTGEFPGFDQNDIQVEFTDAQTLSIKGRTENHREEGTRPTAAVEDSTTSPAPAVAAPEQVTEGSDTSSNYHKPTVEDEGLDSEFTVVNPTPAESAAASAAETPQEEAAATATESEQKPADSSRYWLSERSVGQFSRTFTFPSRVDQEHVKASLKNGILSIVVPKAQIPPSRRINVE